MTDGFKITDELIAELASGKNFDRRTYNYKANLWDFHPNPLEDPEKIRGKSKRVIIAAAKVRSKTKKPFTPAAVSKCLKDDGTEMSPEKVSEFLYSLSGRDRKSSRNCGIFVRV